MAQAGFGLEGRSRCGLNPAVLSTSFSRGEDPSSVYYVNAFGPPIESLVADIVQVTTAFWPRQTASHEELLNCPTHLKTRLFVLSLLALALHKSLKLLGNVGSA